VLAGSRGERAKRDNEARARLRIGMLGAGGTAAGSWALITGSTDARLAALVPVGLAAIVAPFALTGRVKNLAGEILVAAALAGTLVPVAVASHVTWSYAFVAAGVWFTSFLLATLTVHALKAKTKGHLSPRWTVVAAPVLGVAVAGAAILAGSSPAIPRLAALALLPPALATLAINLMGVHPRRLKRVGWSLVTANVLTAVLLLAA
jgi:hypothetical protein